MSEYDKYMVTPEGTMMNKGMTLSEFKQIYAWEWGHRFLGRMIGIALLAPIPYFIYKRKVSRKTGVYLFGIATLVGGQGALGWYMVKSGLTHEAIQARDGVPRVSQYRLAAHLGMAFLVYALALRHAISIRRDWNLAKLGKGIAGSKGVGESLRALSTPQSTRLRVLVTGLTGLVFFTAISGKLASY
jgi:cytochrome c oxidase assembly protein subunit 15